MIAKSSAPGPARRPWVIGLFWSFLGAFFAAGYLVPYKAAIADVGPAGVVLPMFLAAAAISSLIDWILSSRARSRGAPPRSWGGATFLVVAILGAASAVGNEAVCQAMTTIGAGLVSIVLRTQVIFVAVGAFILLRERVGIRFWLGVALALGGFALMQPGLETAGPVSLVGLLWAVLAAAAFATMQITVRRTISWIDPVQVNALRLWLSAALVALLPGRVEALGSLDGRTWALVTTAAISGPVLSRLSLMRALRYLPAAHATLALFAGPLFAYLLAGAVFGTWPGAMELAGGLVILAAVALPVTEMARAGRRPGDGEAPPGDG